MKDATSFPILLESFFTKRLIAQRRASSHTIGSYRDAFRLLLQFAEQRLGKAPSRLTLEDLQAPFLGVFLDSLESTRANGARSRNLRLAAIRSFFSLYCAGSTPVLWADPARAGNSQQTAAPSACGLPHSA